MANSSSSQQPQQMTTTINNLPVLPLRSFVLLPGATETLWVVPAAEQEYTMTHEYIWTKLSNGSEVMVAAVPITSDTLMNTSDSPTERQKRQRLDSYPQLTASDLHPVGCLARVVQLKYKISAEGQYEYLLTIEGN